VDKKIGHRARNPKGGTQVTNKIGRATRGNEEKRRKAVVVEGFSSISQPPTPPRSPFSSEGRQLTRDLSRCIANGEVSELCSCFFNDQPCVTSKRVDQPAARLLQHAEIMMLARVIHPDEPEGCLALVPNRILLPCPNSSVSFRSFRGQNLFTRRIQMQRMHAFWFVRCPSSFVDLVSFRG
jgi:hypothetical protein